MFGGRQIDHTFHLALEFSWRCLGGERDVVGYTTVTHCFFGGVLQLDVYKLMF